MAIKVFKASDYFTSGDTTVRVSHFMEKIAEVWGDNHEHITIDNHSFVIRRQDYTSDYAWFFTFATSSTISLSNTVNSMEFINDLVGTSLTPTFGVMNINDGSQFIGEASYYAGWKGSSRISRSSFNTINNLFNAIYTLQYDKFSNVTASAIYPYAVTSSDMPFMLQPNVLEVEDAENEEMLFIKLPQYSDSTIVLMSRDLTGDTYSENQHTPAHITGASGTTLQALQAFDGKHLFPNIYTYNTGDYTILNGVRDMSQIVESDIGVRYPAINIGGDPYGVVMYANGANSCGVLIK